MLSFDTELNQSEPSAEREVVVTSENRNLARQELERLDNMLRDVQTEIRKLREREQAVLAQLEAWKVIANSALHVSRNW